MSGHVFNYLAIDIALVWPPRYIEEQHTRWAITTQQQWWMLISTAPPPLELETLSCRVLTIDCQAASYTKSISHVSSYVLINYLVYICTRPLEHRRTNSCCSIWMQLETVTLVPITDEVYIFGVYRKWRQYIIVGATSSVLISVPVCCSVCGRGRK